MNDLPNQFDAAHKVASFPSIRPSVPERTTGERRKFRTIWISDVHLGTKGCNHELLIDFLDRNFADFGKDVQFERGKPAACLPITF